MRFWYGVIAGIALTLAASWLLPESPLAPTGSDGAAPRHAVPTAGAHTVSLAYGPARETLTTMSVDVGDRPAPYVAHPAVADAVAMPSDASLTEPGPTPAFLDETPTAPEAAGVSNDPAGRSSHLDETYAAVIDKDRQRPRNVAALHDEFAAQARNPEWADAAELLLAQALIDPAIKQGVVVMDIRCQETLCEVQAQGNSQSAIGDWYHLVDRFRRRDRKFGYVTWDSNEQDGQTYIVTLFERRPR